jgi:hypothetical protein
MGQVVADIKSEEKKKGRKFTKDERAESIRFHFFTDTVDASRFSQNSLVAQTLKQNSAPGTWGTENDLLRLAEELDLCMIIHRKGRPVFIPHNDVRPIIRINQPWGGHWNTIFAEVAPYQPQPVIPPVAKTTIWSRNKWELLGIGVLGLIGGGIGAGLVATGVFAPFGIAIMTVIGLGLGTTLGGLTLGAKIVLDESRPLPLPKAILPKVEPEPYFAAIGYHYQSNSDRRFEVQKRPPPAARPERTPSEKVTKQVQNIQITGADIEKCLADLDQFLGQSKAATKFKQPLLPPPIATVSPGEPILVM